MRIMLYTLVLLLLMGFPQSSAKAARDALCIWGLDVVPSLFPYMVFSRLLAQQLRQSPLPPAPVAASLGLLGGSPSGAAVVSAYGDSLSPRATRALCALTGTISPMFILGTIGRWSGDAALCRRLLVCHLLGACFAGAFAYLFSGKARMKARTENACGGAADSPLRQSVDAILQVGGCILCCSVLASQLQHLPWMPASFRAILHALLEISGGAQAICQTAHFADGRGLLLSALLGFSGLSILSQNHAVLQPLGLRMADLIGFALLRALGSCICMLLLA